MHRQIVLQGLMDWLATSARGQNPGRVREDCLLMKEGYIDSLGMMSLISYVETLLNREIPDELMSFENFESVQKIMAVFFPETASA